MTDELEETQQEGYDANDPEQIEAASKAANRLSNKKLRVVEAIMGNEDGRAWMYDVLDFNCHVFADNPMRDTPERNGRFEGERAVGLRLLTEILAAAPEQFWLMRKEALAREVGK